MSGWSSAIRMRGTRASPGPPVSLQRACRWHAFSLDRQTGLISGRTAAIILSPATGSSQKRKGANPAMSQGRILIADDQIDILDALKLLLGSEGYEVVTVTAPDDLLREVDRNEFDVA